MQMDFLKLDKERENQPGLGSACRSSVAEHWLHKPGVLGSKPAFHFPLFSPLNISLYWLSSVEQTHL